MHGQVSHISLGSSSTRCVVYGGVGEVAPSPKFLKKTKFGQKFGQNSRKKIRAKFDPTEVVQNPFWLLVYI